MTLADDFKARVDGLRAGPVYQWYQEVRDRILAYKGLDAASDTGEASAYWTEELGNIEYLFDASPLVVDKLRHHCFHVTGVRPFDYRTNKARAARDLGEKLTALIEAGGRDLLVPEAEALGGFGFDIDGSLYNIDTLKFFEVLQAMEQGRVLDSIRGASGRPVACEIGSGWGGFAYQFKTLFPQVTYAIVDLPELFLFSAVYLKALFPDATFAFLDDDGANGADLDSVDFLFVPNTLIGSWHPARLDLTLNMVSFMEMTKAQVQEYVHWAADHDSRFLYSLNRDRSYYSPDVGNVREIIGERFDLDHITVMPVDYTQPLRKPRRSPVAQLRSFVGRRILGRSASAVLGYRHVVATPRPVGSAGD